MGIPPVPQVKALSNVPGRVSWVGLNSGRSEQTFPEVTAEKCSLIFESFQCDNTLGRMILACVCELLDFILAVRERATAEVQSQKAHYCMQPQPQARTILPHSPGHVTCKNVFEHASLQSVRGICSYWSSWHLPFLYRQHADFSPKLLLKRPSSTQLSLTACRMLFAFPRGTFGRGRRCDWPGFSIVPSGDWKAGSSNRFTH